MDLNSIRKRIEELESLEMAITMRERNEIDELIRIASKLKPGSLKRVIRYVDIVKMES